MNRFFLYCFVFLVIPCAFAQKVTRYEYWFDQNYVSKVTANISPVQSYSFNQVISSSGLAAGVHEFNIRFADDSLRWTSVQSQYFIRNTQASVLKTITDYEYWFDNNYSNATNQSISPQSQFTLNTLLSTSPLNDGLHVFNIRFKDSQGEWSEVQSQYFIRNTQASVSKSITGYEYWFDNNYSNATNQSISPQSQFTLNTLLSTSPLNDGLHVFNIRFKDSQGEWSEVQSQYFIRNTQASVSNIIIAYRYWFDSDSIFFTAVLPIPIHDYTFAGNISMVQIPKGQHIVHFQFQDSTNRWSLVTSDSVFKNPLPVAYFSANQTVFCDSGTVTFTNQSIDADVYSWNLGDGNYSTDSVVVHTYSSPGIYSVSLTVTDTASGLDSTYTLNLTINSSTNSSIITTACNSFMLNSQTYFSSGTYTQILTNTAGCDSTITLNLTINNSTNSSITTTTCDSFILNNQTYFSSGTYTQTLTNTAGCDSTITLNLTINNSTNNSITTTACDSFMLNNQTYFSSGTYTQTLTNTAGCDSTITLNLTINAVDTSVAQNENILTSNAAGDVFQWINCNGNIPITGETNQSFTANANGNYAVIVTQNTCTDTSDCFNIIIVSADENSLSNTIEVFPNPSKGTFTIITKEKEFALVIFNIFGEKIYQSLVNRHSSLTNPSITYVPILIDFSDKPNGIYFLQVKYENKAAVKKIILNK